MGYKERPKHRQIILQILKDNPHVSILDLVGGWYIYSVSFGRTNKMLIPHETMIQAKKMYEEGNFNLDSNCYLTKEILHDRLHA